MPDRIDLLHRTNRSVFFIDQGVQNHLYGYLMVRHILFDNRFTLRSLMFQSGAADADPLATALCDHFLRIHIDELIFKRRTAGIYNQNFHFHSLRIA